jgi:hypothetical protein
MEQKLGPKDPAQAALKWQKCSILKGIAEPLRSHISDATAPDHRATQAPIFIASNCSRAAQKMTALRDNVYEYCLANCNTMALEGEHITLEFSSACINPDACIGNLYLN